MVGERLRHGWIQLDEYLKVHDRRISDYSHFILQDFTEWRFGSTRVSLLGELVCQGGLELSITKYLEADFRNGRRKVRTYRYKYHLLRRDEAETQNILRYDNIHLHKGHPDRHHRHDYSDGDPTDAGVVRHVGAVAWPTLSQVIEEAEQIWLDVLDCGTGSRAVSTASSRRPAPLSWLGNSP
jgi:hypothetical protein